MRRHHGRAATRRSRQAPHDKALRELVGDLSTLSPEFRTRWAQHNVRLHHGGVKRFHHRDVGSLELTYQSLHLPTSLQTVHTLTTYTAEPRSTSEDRFKLLASLTATSHRDERTHRTHLLSGCARSRRAALLKGGEHRRPLRSGHGVEDRGHDPLALPLVV